MRARAGGGLVIALAVWSLLPGGGAGPVAAQGVPVGTAQNAVGTLVVVRTDGIEHRLQGRGSLPLYEGDVLRTEAASQALIQLRPGIPAALNERTTLKILSRWDKTGGTIRILRVSRGGVWAKAGDGARQLEIESPAAVAAARDAEIDVKVGEDGQTALTVDRERGSARRGVYGPTAGQRGDRGVLEAGGDAVSGGRPQRKIR
jgi:hypothetical protein